MSLKKKNVFFLDLQTTGAKPDTAFILEMAWAAFHNEEVRSEVVRLPEEDSVPRRIQFITGINDKMMQEAMPLPKVLQEFKKFLATLQDDKPVAIIHFAQFEKPFLLDAFQKLDEEMPFDILCTHEIAKRLFPNLPTRGIKGLAGYFGCPSGELKRAEGHVKATQVIWQGLLSALEEKGLNNFAEIQNWLLETPKATRSKYEYPLKKEIRLGLPKEPGVYRMLSRWGEILYVGKATSLHDRVNSYFRGQKNRDPRKLEMLTQVYDLRVTPVGSPLEAALLETDEIKKWNPPYNVSLKVGHRELAFFNRDFTSVQNTADKEHCLGPFSNALALDSILRLSESLKKNDFDENIFYEPLDKDLLRNGFQLFCERHGFESKAFSSPRSILAVGLNWYRQLEDSTEEPQELTESEELVEETDTDVELTAEDLADKFERHFIRSAAAYRRTQNLTKLLNSAIEIHDEQVMHLKIAQGQVVSSAETISCSSVPWQNLSIETYDRMTVLQTELTKLESKNIKVIKKYFDKKAPERGLSAKVLEL